MHGEAAVQVRVVQDYEPDHFVLIFKGRMLVYDDSIGCNIGDGKSSDDVYINLFHVRGNKDIYHRAVQVVPLAEYLCSGDCFILETPEFTYVWFGKVSHSNNISEAAFI